MTVHIKHFRHLQTHRHQLDRQLEIKNDSNYQLRGLEKLLELLVWIKSQLLIVQKAASVWLQLKILFFHRFYLQNTDNFTCKSFNILNKRTFVQAKNCCCPLGLLKFVEYSWCNRSTNNSGITWNKYKNQTNVGEIITVKYFERIKIVLRVEGRLFACISKSAWK